jgi:DNA-binding transcriptional ArsR family regulator
MEKHPAEQHRSPGNLNLEAGFFKALGDPTRLSIFMLLLQSNQRLSVSEIQRQLDKKLTTVSECLQELKAAKLVDCVRSGIYRLYAANSDYFRTQLEGILREI